MSLPKRLNQRAGATLVESALPSGALGSGLGNKCWWLRTDYRQLEWLDAESSAQSIIL